MDTRPVNQIPPDTLMAMGVDQGWTVYTHEPTHKRIRFVRGPNRIDVWYGKKSTVGVMTYKSPVQWHHFVTEEKLDQLLNDV